MLSEFFSVRGILILVLTIVGALLTFRNPKFGLMAFIILLFSRAGFLIVEFPIIYKVLHLPKFFGILTLISLFLHINKYPIRVSFEFWLMLLFFLVICLSRQLAGTGIFTNKTPMEFLKMCVLFFLIINVLRTEKDLSHIFWTVILINFFLVLYHYYHYKTGWKSIFVLPNYQRLNRNEFGANLAAVTGLLYYLFKTNKNKTIIIFLGLCFLSFVGGVILTYSRSAFLGLVSVSFLLALSSKHKFQIMILMILLSLVIGYRVSEKYFDRLKTVKSYEKDPSAMGRIATNKAAMNIIKTHPLLGIGAGNFPTFFLDYTPEDLKIWVRPGKQIHNIFLQATSETGLIGLSIFISLFLASFIKILKIKKLCYKNENLQTLNYAATSLGIALICYCIVGQFHPGAYYGYFYIYLPLTASLLNIVFVS